MLIINSKLQSIQKKSNITENQYSKISSVFIRILCFYLFFYFFVVVYNT